MRQLYDEEKYVTHDKFSEIRFNRDCLAEYSGIIKTVCVRERAARRAAWKILHRREQMCFDKTSMRKGRYKSRWAQYRIAVAFVQVPLRGPGQ